MNTKTVINGSYAIYRAHRLEDLRRAAAAMQDAGYPHPGSGTPAGEVERRRGTLRLIRLRARA